MSRYRPLVAALLALWLVLGPAGSAWAATSASTPCESMGASVPADDCCGDKMEAAACLSACLLLSPGITTTAADTVVPAEFIVYTIASVRYASLLAPPDIVPPRSFVS